MAPLLAWLFIVSGSCIMQVMVLLAVVSLLFPFTYLTSYYSQVVFWVTLLVYLGGMLILLCYVAFQNTKKYFKDKFLVLGLVGVLLVKEIPYSLEMTFFQSNLSILMLKVSLVVFLITLVLFVIGWVLSTNARPWRKP